MKKITYYCDKCLKETGTEEVKTTQVEPWTPLKRVGGPLGYYRDVCDDCMQRINTFLNSGL